MIDVRGVGYQVFMPTTSLSKLPESGETAVIHTYLYVREDAMQLYGFASTDEQSLFETLLSVSGIGPKVALAILSCFDVATIKKAIVTEDVDLITSIRGIGKKNAQRLILELKERLDIPDGEPATALGPGARSVYLEAKNALLGLGYSPLEARSALEGFDFSANPEVSLEQLIKYALKKLAG